MPRNSSGDKRVYDVRASDGARACVLAISGDAALLDLHLALLGAFDWAGDFGVQERGAYHIEFPQRTGIFTAGRGSRTRVRRVLAEGERFICEARDPHIVVECEVLRTYEVSSRRHYPKVLDAGGSDNDAQTATWNAQAAARREYRYRGRLDDSAPSPGYAQGMFAAIVAGPLLVPSAWLPEVVGLPDVFEAYNEVARLLSEAPNRFIEQTSRTLAADASGRVLELWVRGFVHGMALNDAAWKSVLHDDTFRRLFMPIAGVMEIYSSPAKRKWLYDRELREKFSLACAIAVVQIARYWRPELDSFRKA